MSVTLTYHGPDSEIVDLGTIVSDGDKISVDAELADKLALVHGFEHPRIKAEQATLKTRTQLAKQAAELGLEVLEHHDQESLAVRIKAAGGDPHRKSKGGKKKGAKKASTPPPDPEPTTGETGEEAGD